jgi:DNA-binding GntR family transcriptional regulator
MSNLVTVSTVDAVAAALRIRVLDGALPPGTFIRESQVAAEYGVARHTVRAATQQLTSEGLLRRAPNRGVHVPELDADDVVDVFRLRAALESEAVRLLVTDGTTPTEAVAASVWLDSLAPDATWAEVVEADLAFHHGIIAGTASPRLARAYATAQAEIKLCMVQLRPHYQEPAEVAAEHRELLVALRSTELDVADVAFRRHWQDASDNLLRTLSPHTSPERL